MNEIRKQLTLFIEKSNENIEKIRAEFNPEQFDLIKAHVTLCREDEIEPIDKIIERIRSINLKKPIRIEFNGAERFAGGNGVLIPAKNENIEFRELRETILGQNKYLKEHFPHITLMHPRNSKCDDEKFEQILNRELPTVLEFEKISLIEQKNGGKWKILSEFKIVE